MCEYRNIRTDKQCLTNPVKNSIYCAIHKFRVKTSHSKPCSICQTKTCSIYQVCYTCGGNIFCTLRRYYKTVRDYEIEARRLRQIFMKTVRDYEIEARRLRQIFMF
jgi:hypothetical protein